MFSLIKDINTCPKIAGNILDQHWHVAGERGGGARGEKEKKDRKIYIYIVSGRPTIWMKVGQGPIALAVGAGGGCLDIFTLLYPFLRFLPLSGRRSDIDRNTVSKGR